MGDGVEGSLEKLRIAGLAARDHAGHLSLLTEFCCVACLPKHGWVAGENSSGRFTRWVERQMRDGEDAPPHDKSEGPA